jgi:predicted O-linked N-acetylglucosamine transferase (SPINDLY family)
MTADPEKLFAGAAAAHRKGDFALAARRLEKLRAAFPDHPDVLHLLGHVRLGQGRPLDAIGPLRQAVRAAEDANRKDILVSILNALGSAERRAGDPAKAAQTLARAARLAPGDTDVHFNLGNALADSGRLVDAAASFRRAAELSPGDAAIRFALGETLARMGENAGAADAYVATIGLDPGHAKAHAALGAFRLDANDLAGARAALGRALELDPDLAEAHLNLGLLQVAAGDADSGLAATRRAHRLKPSLVSAHSNLVQQMSYSARCSAADILAEARRWNDAHAKPLAARIQPPANQRDPERRLKVGYVGGDFRAHPVGFFTLALFAHHDADAFETFVYMTHPRTDVVSDRIRASVAHWRDAVTPGDAELAAMVRNDGIDILVDMAGHTARNRLLALAMRPAPVQAVGGGVMGTTGVDAVDYFLADRVEIPPGFEKFYSEAVVRLPHDNVCYAPPEHAPPVAPLPARAEEGPHKSLSSFPRKRESSLSMDLRLRGGDGSELIREFPKTFVTFGCFNAAAKVTPETVALWARVLAAVPDSRLLLKSFAYADAGARARFLRLFAEAGVPESRVTLEGPSPHAELLAAYGRVDIALDPMPYSGGLTTLESLWMGVPVVSLPGETFASRHSASHLTNAGLPELVAATADDYVAIARRLASDLDSLETLRAGLRARLAASPVCDGAAYARGLEAAYREMWRRWCAGERPSAMDIPPS